MNTRILAAISAASLLVSFAVKADEPTLTERIDNANTDLKTVQVPIPHAALHAKALEILRGMTVAKEDEVSADATARADAEACVTFSQSLEKETCK